MEEYDDKSSDKFKALCEQIEKEVTQVVTATNHVILIFKRVKKVKSILSFGSL